MKGPVTLSPHEPQWARLFAAEKARLLSALSPYVVAVEHIGSTAVPGLAAKATIDIDVALFRMEDAPRCIRRMKALGYEYLPELERETPERRYFKRAAVPVDSREDLFHVHMVAIGSPWFERDQLFRDYLRAHKESAREYEELKHSLAEKHGGDREAYTAAKTEFVLRTEAAARAERLQAKPAIGQKGGAKAPPHP